MMTAKRAVVLVMDAAEARQLMNDMNEITNFLAQAIADAGDVDDGHPLADLSAAAHRFDRFRLDVEALRDEH